MIKRGKKPPIELKLSLTRSEYLYRRMYKTGVRPHLDNGAKAWINLNCMVCAHKNTERLVEAALTGDEMYWKHICIHKGPVTIIAITRREQGINNCSGFEPENFPKTSLENH